MRGRHLWVFIFNVVMISKASVLQREKTLYMSAGLQECTNRHHGGIELRISQSLLKLLGNV